MSRFSVDGPAGSRFFASRIVLMKNGSMNGNINDIALVRWPNSRCTRFQSALTPVKSTVTRRATRSEESVMASSSTTSERQNRTPFDTNRQAGCSRK